MVTLKSVCAFAPVDDARIVTEVGVLNAVVVTVTVDPDVAPSEILVVSVSTFHAGA